MNNEVFMSKRKELENMLDSCKIDKIDLNYDVRNLIKESNMEYDANKDKSEVFAFIDNYCKEQNYINENVLYEDVEAADEMEEDTTIQPEKTDNFKPTFNKKINTMEIDIANNNKVVIEEMINSEEKDNRDIDMKEDKGLFAKRIGKKYTKISKEI
jgi:hypothetical protein